MANLPHFIIIDDSPLDCFIGEKIIQNSETFCSIRSYTQATKALEEIKKSDPVNEEPVTVIVLDIQMPIMNGFQFVEAFEQLPENVQSRYAIFMYSSSNNENDKNRMKNHPTIRKFYNKPISKEIIASILESL